MNQRLLTLRELEYAGHVARGLSNKQIAIQMGITPGSAKMYMVRIRAKDPSIYTRAEMVKHPLRRHAREQAYQWGEWLKRWQDGLPDAARSEFLVILCTQVAECLGRGPEH